MPLLTEQELAAAYSAQAGLNALEYVRLGMASDAYRCARQAVRLARSASRC
jgi:hypothetical protein